MWPKLVGVVMWQTVYQQSFVLGAILVLIYQAAKFSELNLGDPITSRYVALLPGARVRDFAGPYAYHVALVAFLGASFLVYFLLCRISPTLLTGAAKLFGAEAETRMQDIPFPLYIAALFMGLTQPIIPGLSQFESAQRDFFHNQIEVPRRIIDLSESLTSAIEARSGSDRKGLATELQKLAGADFLKSLQPHGDVAFYKLQLENMEIGNGAPENVINDCSVKELRKLIERLVLCALVAVMRKSGPKSLMKVAERLGVRSPVARRGNLGSLVESLVASGVLFSVGLLIIAHVLSWLYGPVESLFDKNADKGLWPSSLGYVGDELFTIAFPIIVCLFVAVFVWLSRPPHRATDDGAPGQPSLADDFVDFMRASAPILVLCILTSEAINIGQMFYEYGSFHLPPEARSLSRLTLPVIQSFIAVAVCIFTTWYLVSTFRGVGHRRVTLTGTALIIAGVTGVIALLYDQTFMEQYLAVHPEYGPGGDHILFSVIANVLVSVSAFFSVAVFFKTRAKISEAESRVPDPPGATVSGRT
jgi:hypothetical protein